MLKKIRSFELISWNFIGHDPKEVPHYGPMAQDFFAAFGHDSVGKIGTTTTINSEDMAGILMSAVLALEKRTAQISVLESEPKRSMHRLLCGQHGWTPWNATESVHPDNSREVVTIQVEVYRRQTWIPVGEISRSSALTLCHGLGDSYYHVKLSSTIANGYRPQGINSSYAVEADQLAARLALQLQHFKKRSIGNALADPSIRVGKSRQ